MHFLPFPEILTRLALACKLQEGTAVIT